MSSKQTIKQDKERINIFSTHKTEIRIGKDQEGSLSLGCYEGSCFPQKLKYDLKDILELSVGPRDNNDGIKSCFTYNPPGAYKPGVQIERMVC